MMDDAIGDSLNPGKPQTNAASIKPPQKMDPAFYATLALVGVLILLIVVMNVPGIRASDGITLTRSDWTLQSYADVTRELVPAISGTAVTARFGTYGRLSGSAGCNQYAASYTTRDFAITISPPVVTMMYCKNPGVIQQESAYINDLAKAVELRVSESNLNLYDTTGKPQLVFEVMR